MALDLMLLKGFYAFSCFVGCAFFSQRWQWRHRRRRGRSRLGFYPSASSLGNALHQLQAIAEPQMAYVIEEKLDEEADEDDEGGPDDPTRHLYRQAAKIRRGERPDRLTVFLRRSE